MYLLDSCVCIELMRGHMPKTMELMKASSPDMFKISCIVEAELLAGAQKSRNAQKTTLLTERFLAPYERLSFSSDSAHIYAKLRADLEGRGLKIGPHDLLIAATALSEGATVITRNVKEFKRVSGLSVEDWEEINW